MTSGHWSKTDFSQRLAGRPSRDTTPELRLRRALHSRGLRYTLHVLVTDRSTADLVFKSAQVAVFVDGCFWHCCPVHGADVVAGPNAELWKDKFERTRSRDARVTDEASKQYVVVRIWEHEIADDLERVCDQIELLVRQRMGSV